MRVCGAYSPRFQPTVSKSHRRLRESVRVSTGIRLIIACLARMAHCVPNVASKGVDCDDVLAAANVLVRAVPLAETVGCLQRRLPAHAACLQASRPSCGTSDRCIRDNDEMILS